MSRRDDADVVPLTGAKKRTKDPRYGTLGSSEYRGDGTDVATGFMFRAEELELPTDAEDESWNLERKGGLKGIAKSLRSDLKLGLTEFDFTDRINAFGRNVYPEAPYASWFDLFLEAFEDLAVIILSIAALVSLAAGIASRFIEGGEPDAWIEGVAIIVAVLIVATVSATNNYSKDLQFRALKEKNADRKVKVMRNGEEQIISIFDVMVGDICFIHQGYKIPADGIFIQVLEEIYVDESSLTGEPEEQLKNTNNCLLYAECPVTRGSGKMLVTAVGDHSRWGKTLALIPEDKPDTPLQEKLDAMVVKIGKVGLFVAVVVFVVLVIYYLVSEPWNADIYRSCGDNNTVVWEGVSLNCSTLPVYYDEELGKLEYVVGKGFQPLSLLEILRAFIISVTIVVVAVPEGLPLAVTISLAYSMSQMMKDQNLVRHLSACETMGGATNICSDKTGTLTENRMTVVEGVIASNEFKSVNELDNLDASVARLVIQASTLNIEEATIIRTHGKPPQFVGSVTECALLIFAERLGANYRELQEAHPPIKKWGFTSHRKRMSSAVKIDGIIRLLCKGAAEMVLQKCEYTLNPDGTTSPINSHILKHYLDKVNETAAKGLRCICIAYRDFIEVPDWDDNSDGVGFEEKLVCIGIIGIEDPLRPEVPHAVAMCRRAGITVRMVTGDNILTACKIARDCGILTNGEAMEGPEFSKKTDEEIDEILPRLQVLARSTPADKFRLVNCLRANGEVVAVTGDGTNDAPALSAADVGLAMGITGTEVAKNAADIIILDDNFASIVQSVKWGRCVYDNIRKFLQFQLTVNVVALIVAFVGAVADFGTPLTAVQLLWVNLIMDTMAALALGTEKPTDRLLYRKPYGKGGKLITGVMWRNILGHGFFQAGILFAILFAMDANNQSLMFPGVESGKELMAEDEPSIHYTMVFNTFVFLQVFNEINSRKVNLQKNVFEGLFTNLIFVGIIVATVVVQVLIVQFGGEAIKTVPLSWDQWLYCVLIGYMTLPYGFLLRFLPVPLEEWEKETEYQLE